MAIEIEPRRNYQQRERRYVVEFVSLRYPDRPTWFNIRLGAPPGEMARRYPGVNLDRVAQVWKKFADAVIVNGPEFVLIEAKIRRPIESVGQISAYRDLIYESPELLPWGHLPVRLVLVTPQEDPSIATLLIRAGIELAVYQPAWVLDYLREINK